MKKEFDVHFLLKFSDFFGGIEANTKEEAIEQVKAYLTELTGLDAVRNSIIENLATGDFEFQATDILELGVDI